MYLGYDTNLPDSFKAQPRFSIENVLISSLFFSLLLAFGAWVMATSYAQSQIREGTAYIPSDITDETIAEPAPIIPIDDETQE